MEGIILIVLVVAAAHAIERGRVFAWTRTKTAASTKWQAYKEKRPVVARGSRAGGATGRAIGAATVGAIEGVRGFGAGARTGWGEGRDKVYAWRDQRRNADAQIADLQASASTQTSEQSVSATGTDGLPALPNEDRPTPLAAPAGSRARLRLIDADEAGNGPAESLDAPAVADQVDGSGVPTIHPENTEGNEDMTTIDTATGGDVQTMEQLIAELETIGKEAAAELEDSQGDAQRAREDAGRIDTMVASLAQLDLDEDSLSEIAALSEDAASRLAAAEARQNAAESRAAHAQQAIDGVRSRHQLMQEAHDATPHAADKRFYGR